MIKKVRIAVDHGNRNMKTCSRVFTTGLTIQDKKPARREKFLFYEGKYYVLSENRIPYQRDKTHDDRFFILTLFAIVKELEENPQIQPEDVIQVDLPIGLPPKHYAELCERYEAYFKRQGKIHDINYCGRTYHITIGEVMAFPQDYAAMMTMIEKLQQIPKVVGIDIGGFTTDYLLMRKGNPDMEACDSMEKGVITMYNKIISGINSEYDILLEESDIDSILQGNTEFYEEAVVRMTEGMVQDFVKDLLNSIRERGIDTKAAYTVFIGGGAKLLSHFLEQSDRLGKYTFIEDISANAKGYDRLFAMLFTFLVGNSNMVYAMGATQVGYASKYITVKGNNMHLALYGKLDASGEKFADEGKTTLVMMPALGVPSPHIYFKPLAQSLGESFNIVIVEPFGYGLSDVAATDRTVDNINSELNAALDTMGIKQCVGYKFEGKKIDIFPE